jgi:uncharacterized protein (UPF0276 family)
LDTWRHRRGRSRRPRAARNFATAARITGAVPLVENVATLIDLPGSALDEAGWLTAVLDAIPCNLLLDLHNLHAARGRETCA